MATKASAQLAKCWERVSGHAAAISEAADLDRAEFRQLWEQESLFEPQTLHVIKRIEKRNDEEDSLVIPIDQAMTLVVREANGRQ